jgi:hypothetical protein
MSIQDYGDMESPEIPADNPEAVLDNLFAELAGQSDLTVSVYRAEASKGFKGGPFLYSTHPDNFSLETLRDEFGSGNYSLHFKRNNKWIRRLVVSVEAKPKPSSGIPGQTAPSFNVSQPDAITKLAESMVTGFRELGQLIVQSNMQRAPERNPLDDLLKMREIFMPVAAPPPPPDNMDVFLKGVEFAKNITPRDSEVGGMEVLMESIKSLAPVFVAGVQQSQQAPQTHPQQQAVIDQRQLPIPETQQVNPDMNATFMARQAVNYLIRQAVADNDPANYAGMVIDQLGEDKTRELMDSSNWFEQLTEVSPAIATHRAWFEELRAIIGEILAGEADNEIAQQPDAIDTPAPDVGTVGDT